MIDSIEHNVAKATDYVEDATEDVILAEKYHKKANKVSRRGQDLPANQYHSKYF
jgi:SNARE domain